MFDANSQRSLDGSHASPSTEETSSPSDSQLSIGSFCPATLLGGVLSAGAFDTAEQRLINVIFRDKAFLEHYLLVPSLHSEHRQAIVSRLDHSTSMLKDCLIAGAGLFSRDHQELTELAKFSEDFWIKKAAKSVSSLRSIQISDRRDISTVLLLGATIVTFAPYLPGSNVLSICRYVLRLISPPSLPLSECRLDLVDSSFLTCLVYTETVCCLFSGQVPTIHLTGVAHGSDVDRYLGLSAPLLPFFYDICQVNKEIKLACGDSGIMCNTDLVRKLEAIESKVNCWQPICSAHFATRFNQIEVLHITQQVLILRLTALLILNRLRLAYGDPIGTARGMVMSKMILSQLETTNRITQRSIICCELAFVVACLELQDEDEQRSTLDNMSDIIGSQVDDQEALRDVIHSFWLIRKHHAGIFWSSLSDILPQTLRWPG